MTQLGIGPGLLLENSAADGPNVAEPTGSRVAFSASVSAGDNWEAKYHLYAVVADWFERPTP